MQAPHPDFPVIDAHVHLYPDALVPKVVPMLSERFGNAPAFDGTVAGCKGCADRSGIALSINLPVATTPDPVDAAVLAGSGRSGIRRRWFPAV